MKSIKREKLSCPHCQNKKLKTSALYCHDCHISITAAVEDNEFALLGSDDLHFLRVFVHSDGKLKDIERALGMSYPSVKAKLERLKKSLLSPQSIQTNSISQVLEQMNQGTLDYQEGLELIKQLKK